MGEVRRYKVNVRYNFGCIEIESYIWKLDMNLGNGRDGFF